VRQNLHEALLEGDAAARDLSRQVGIPEHDVADHLRHLDRSLRLSGERIVVEPSACLPCGFTITHRECHPFTRPDAVRTVTVPVGANFPGRAWLSETHVSAVAKRQLILPIRHQQRRTVEAGFSPRLQASSPSGSVVIPSKRSG
jgi:predicted Zn-ribbon and HTH transcriptional regulator